MAVTVLGFAPETGSGSISDDTISTSVEYKVQTTSFLETEFDVIFALPVTIGSSYVSSSYQNPYLKVRNISADRQDRNSLLWIATVDYETANEEEEDNQEENPLLEPPKIKLSHRDKEVPLQAIVTGGVRTKVDALTNSAGEPFETLTKKAASQVITITKNEPITSNGAIFSYTYKNAVNSDQFWHAPAGYAQCESIEVERQVKNLKSGLQFFI